MHFSGEAPLFPLPNVVLFPHATLPLHIFEPRYRKMTADALQGEQLIAMSLIDTSLAGAEDQSVPPIHPVVGLGQIVTHELLEDGRYMLILRGVARARVILEKDVDLPYRVAKLELCPDIVPSQVEFDRRDRAEQIISLFCRLFSGTEVQKAVHQALSAELPLGTLCDVIASTLPITPSLAQQFLQEQDSDVRSQMLWQLLNRMDEGKTGSTTPAKSFPPVFSRN
jgi:Lon protease-like protein